MAMESNPVRRASKNPLALGTFFPSIFAFSRMFNIRFELPFRLAMSSSPRSRPDRAWSAGISLYYLERARPARLVKEVNDNMRQESQTVSHAAHLILVARSNKRPVNEHRSADYIFPWNESPKAAVIADVAVVAHSEIAAKRHHDVLSLHVLRQRELPFLRDVVHIRRHRGEIFAVGTRELRIGVVFVADVGLFKFFAIAVDHSIPQMNSIAGDADDSLHHKQALLGR